MDLMRIGGQAAYPETAIGNPGKMPSITERLAYRKKDLEAQLDEVNKALDALTKNTDFQAIFDLVSQVRY